MRSKDDLVRTLAAASGVKPAPPGFRSSVLKWRGSTVAGAWANQALAFLQLIALFPNRSRPIDRTRSALVTGLIPQNR